MADSVRERTLVILIISLVVVALSITFLTKMKNGDELTAALTENTDAPPANIEDSITLSDSEVVIKQGNAQMISISIYNPTSDIISISPLLKCPDETITYDTHTISIPPQENTQVTLLIKTTKETLQDLHICIIETDNTLLSLKEADLLIRVI